MQSKACFIYISLFSVLFFSSCVSQKKISYFQEAESKANEQMQNIVNTYEPIIQSNDILSIHITNINKEASSIFNSISATSSVSNPGGASVTDEGYLVDTKGFVEMPVLGPIKVGGLTSRLARDTIKKRLEPFLENPSVFIRFINYRVTVLGEVARPASFTIPNERITIPEAIGLAGDLTIHGKRKTVTVIREEQGKRIFGKVDLTSREVFNSPYYYLHNNDIVYVEPGKAKSLASSELVAVLPLILSTLTVLSLVFIRLQ
jgi:polysaccharide biosynthesis/export protein